MARLILLNKPYQVLSQFRDSQGRATLSAFLSESDVYPAGRLDYDSEGLLLLTDSGTLQARIADPRYKMKKCYRVQVEGDVDQSALNRLTTGVVLKDGPAQALSAARIAPPTLWPRHPPIRHRPQQTTSWMELTIAEGRNRQVRRMTAAAGFPTLRLVRWSVGPWSLDDLSPGQHRSLDVHLPSQRRQDRNHRKGRNPTKR